MGEPIEITHGAAIPFAAHAQDIQCEIDREILGKMMEQIQWCIECEDEMPMSDDDDDDPWRDQGVIYG